MNELDSLRALARGIASMAPGTPIDARYVEEAKSLLPEASPKCPETQAVRDTDILLRCELPAGHSGRHEGETGWWAEATLSDEHRAMCPHCGETFDGWPELIPTHDWPKLTRQVCPGSKQIPRNSGSDRRALWKDHT